MKKIFVITLLVYFLLILENVLFQFLGSWGMPNLLLLLIIFVNLTLGIRYSIFTAVLAGALKDSLSIDFFGLNLFSFVLCAYMTTILCRYIYQKGSFFSQLLLVFVICLINISFHYVMSFGIYSFTQVIQYVLVTEILTTLLVTSFVFKQFRKCVLRYFVL